MAGTSSLHAPLMANPHIHIVLMQPQMGENIGMAVRAMVNCGLSSLRLVAPRDGWPSESAMRASAGGMDFMNVAVFTTLEEAISDLTYVIATTARPRVLAKPALTFPQSCEILHKQSAHNPVGLLFGPEKAGLTNDDVALADATVTLDLNPAFASLNLAQAVLLFSHKLLEIKNPTTETPNLESAAPKADWIYFFEKWEDVLTQAGFLGIPEKRDQMIRNLRTMLMRGQFSHSELQTLHGVFKSLLMADGKAFDK